MNSDPTQDVMAKVCYDFPSKYMPEIRIVGSIEVRTLDGARKIVEQLNAEYGEGSHWVEPLNYTYAERLAE